MNEHIQVPFPERGTEQLLRQGVDDRDAMRGRDRSLLAEGPVRRDQLYGRPILDRSVNHFARSGVQSLIAQHHPVWGHHMNHTSMLRPDSPSSMRRRRRA